MKNYKIPIKIYWALIPLGVLSLLFFFFHQPLLIAAGGFLAPEGEGNAEVVIIEGTEIVRAKAISTALNLLASGRAKRLLVVLQENPSSQELFALKNYPLLVARELEAAGLSRNRFEIVPVRAKHPITLQEARDVLRKLLADGQRKAILLADAFHTRRSYWAYKDVGSRLGIEIIPHPVFIFYEKTDWWQREEGLREFSSELFKFFYYLAFGHIPLKSLLVT